MTASDALKLTPRSWERAFSSGVEFSDCAGGFAARVFTFDASDLDLFQGRVSSLEHCETGFVTEGPVAFGELARDKSFFHRREQARVFEGFNPVGPDDALGSRRHEGSLAL